MHPLDPSARDALAAYKRSRSPDERARQANWAAIGNAITAEEIAGPSVVARRGLTKWIATGVTFAAAAGLVAGLTLGPHRLQHDAQPSPSAATYSEMPGPTPTPEAELHDEAPTPVRRSAPRALVPQEPPADPPASEPPPVEPSADDAPRAPSSDRRVKAALRERAVETVELAIDPVETLREEAELLRSARAATAGGRPQRTIELVRRYRAEFPSGELAEEIDALELAALCQTGPEEAWRRAVDAFDARHPRSPLRAGVRDDCFDTP